VRDLPATEARLRDSDQPKRDGPGSRFGTIRAAELAAAEQVRALSTQAEKATLQYREAAARAASAEPVPEAANAAVDGIIELHAQAVRLNGTLGAARIMLAKLEAEVRWARRYRGMRQLHPKALLGSARLWSNKQARKVHRSGLFDAGWYLWSHPEVEASGEDPLRHYLRAGWKEGRDPSPFFSIAWYFEANPDVHAAGSEPLSHYIDHGVVEGRDPHPLFKGRWYLQQNNDVAQSGANPLFHYIHAGGAEGRDPHPWFRTEWYLAENPDVARSGLNPLFHYIACGAAEGRDTHPWFKSDWYLAQHPKTARLGAAEASAPLPERLQPSLPPALGQLLRMFHDESVAPVIESCSALLGTNGADETRITSLVQRAAHLAGGKAGEIEATVVIPAADGVADTLCSLYSALSLQTKICHEIVVASDDAAVRALVARIGGVVRSAAIDGWPGIARGRVLAFLAPRSIVLPNWLDELVDTIRSDASIGLVGSKRVGLDGALQGDTSGELADPCAPQCNYLEDVTAVSTVSMAIARTLWEKLGVGFAGDLAEQVRAAGLRTVYQPLSAVIHEGPASGDAPVAQLQPARRPRILVMDHSVPQPDRDAGSRSAVQYLQIFTRAGLQVTYWPQDLYFDRPYVTALQRIGVEVMYGWSGVWPEFDTWLAQNSASLGYAYLFRPTCAVNFIDRLRQNTKARIMFAGVDVHYKRLEMEAEKIASAAVRNDAKRMERLEKDIWQKSDVVYYLSDSEVDLVKATFPAKNAQVIPIFMFDPARLHQAAERARRSGIPDGRQLLFVGGFRHSPNADAVTWFVGEIWPRILAAVPDARLTIAGSSPPPAVRQLASDAITVSGTISDEELIRRYGEVTAAIVPLRFGAGVKGKLLEAVSYGAPVVTTSVGTQGLAGLEPFLDVHDDAQGFADSVIAILQAPGSRIDKVLGGLAYLEQNFTQAAALRMLSEEIPELRPYLDAAHA
jgi:glycosyltransferase involved in cell wall biosynthesis